MKRIGVIGAGRFGTALVENLAQRGAEVLVLDCKKEIVQRMSTLVEEAVHGDATNMDVLMGTGFQKCDAVVVAIGTNMEASILAVMNLKEIKVSNIIAKAGSDMHGKVLERIGATQVIYPEKERAQRLARGLLARSAVDYFEISDGVSVAEIKAPNQFVGKTLVDANIRKAYGVTILAIKRGEKGKEKQINIISPTGDDVIQEGDTLLLFGPDNKLEDIS